MGVWVKVGAGLRRLQWTRGLRAGVAVAAAMIVCHLLGKPMGWAALGGFEAILVDNGGPYRSRLTTISTLMLGGALGCVVGALASTPLENVALGLILACGVTAAFSFATTFARVVAQPVASTSVIILVIYFAGYGGGTHDLRGALWNALAFVLGGAWAAVLSLGLWPVDPFRPARRAVGECYGVLAEFAASATRTAPHSSEREAERLRIHDFQRAMRITMEAARGALETTAARTTARTVRARNLTVLLETADILFSETIRWVELLEATGDVADGDVDAALLLSGFRWMSGAERAVARGLEHRPQDGGASFAPEGSHSLEHVRRRTAEIRAHETQSGSVLRYLIPEERDALQNIEIAFESVRAVWTGAEIRAGGAAERWEGLARRSAAAETGAGWTDAVRANWTRESLMMRHALRVAVVGAVDVLLMQRLHVSHGSWLAMTSIIVLQPYGSGTLRKSFERVGGTIAGGVLAALLAVSIHSQIGIIAVVTVTSALTLATYAVDYAWYSFFLTPTFVLLGLPRLRDWHFAGVRMGMTVLGAAVALAAMRLLWREREHFQLGLLLGRGATADAAYVRAMLRFWSVAQEQRPVADRELMAPARRRCGLAINDAEEALDRLMLEPSFGRRSSDGKDVKTTALTFVTYLRRLTRSVTTLEGVGVAEPSTVRRVEAIADRLESVGKVLQGGGTVPLQIDNEAPEGSIGSVTEQQVRRMERQTSVMERAATAILQETA
ncbi:MAG: putative integral rane protein [Acidobacteriaceae bacterium]|nr:putative integral rane protein [Acidobacteriaceae bacterium]